MSIQFNPYTVLGIADEASDEEVKRAYRRLAQRLHPDKNQSNPGAQLQFQDISAAYQILTNPDQRDRYRRKSSDTQDAYFSLRVTPSKRTLEPLEEEQVVYLLAEVVTPPQFQQRLEQETPLNLTLLIDHSNSMKGVRLERVKAAAQNIIKRLGPKDILSVVAFNDRATVIIPATTVQEKAKLQSSISLINPAGSTEMFHALSEGVNQARTYLGPRTVNHIILLTDGHTYGDEERCLQLARAAADEGIGISAMGLGTDWNDDFLDKVAGATGGSSIYIDSLETVVRFLDERVRSLSKTFADRMQLIVAPDPDVQLEMAFQITPDPQPLDIVDGAIPLSNLLLNRQVSVLLQVQMPPRMAEGFRSAARLVVKGSILANGAQPFQAVSDISLEIHPNADAEEPPTPLMDALSKLTLYRLQERAKAALDDGNIAEATRRLENLATRLLEMGESQLAERTLAEADQLAHTNALSQQGRKQIKYQTRALLLSADTGKPWLQSDE